MYKTTLPRIARPLRRNYSGHPPHPVSTKETHALAEDALAQKSGAFKATLPKGDKKPAKANGGKDNPWKPVAIGTSVTLGALLGGLLYYGRPIDGHDKVRE
jgi:import inner membrane translocase subunit TIM50